MKKPLLILVLLVCFSKEQRAQQWIWDTLESRWGWQVRMEKDAYGKLYSFQLYDTIILKQSSTGQHLYQIDLPKKFRIQNIAPSADSSLYVLGVFSGTLNVNGHIAISKGADDVCLAKYSSSGSIMWLTSFGSKKNDRGADVCMLGSDVLVIGNAKDTIQFASQTIAKDTLDEIFIGRFFSTGQLNSCEVVRYITYQQYNFAISEEIVTDHAGNIYALTWLRGNFLWANDTIVQPYSQCVLKFSNNFQYQGQFTTSTYYSDVAHDLRFNTSNEMYYLLRSTGKYTSYSEINKLSTFTSTLVNQYSTGGGISAIDLDSCDNVYFIGSGDNSWPGPYVPLYWIYEGMLSPSGNLNWLRSDTLNQPVGGHEIASTGLNKVFCVVWFHDTISLVNTYTTQLHGARYVHAILQATFGVPTNVTPAPYIACAGKTMSLQCSTGGAVHWYPTQSSNTILHIGNTFTINPPGLGTFTYYAEARTCTNVSGRLPVTFSVFPNPTITVSHATICAGDQYVISPSPALTYSYSSNTATISTLTNKTYTVFGTEAAGCSDTALCKIVVKPTPSIFVQPSQNPVCKNSAVTVSLTGAITYSINQVAVFSTHTFTPSASAQIYVSGSGSNGCSNTTSYLQYVADCTLLQDISNSQNVAYYPNPTNGVLFVKTEQPVKLLIVNSLGQTVLTKDLTNTENKLDLSALMDGVYLIKSAIAGKRTIQKIVLRK